MTIRRRLTWTLVLGSAALLGLAGTGVYLTVRAALLHEFDAGLRTKALGLAAATEQGEDGIVIELGDAFLRNFEGPSAPDFYEIWRDEGAPMARSKSLDAADLPRTGAEHDGPVIWNIRLAAGVPARAIGVTFTPEPTRRDRFRGVQAPPLTLVVASDRRALDRTLGTLALVLTGAGVALLAAIAALVPSTLRRALHPVDRLADAAAAVNADSLSYRFPERDLPEELRPIGSRLNDLLGRLEGSFERERRFSADVAHELRTPIAELRALAELAMTWPDTRAADADREVLAIAMRMETIVTALLALLRGEHRQLRVARTTVELGPMVEAAVRPLAARAAARGLTVDRIVRDAPTIESDPVLLQSILANLLENAVEYSPAGSRIEVNAAAAAGRFTVTVVNPAERLSAGEVPRLFDRFWRADAARAGGDHLGLGLPLARAFARALGCDLSAALDAGRLAVTLAGPAALGPGAAAAINSRTAD